jgi:hypothetical protein
MVIVVVAYHHDVDEGKVLELTWRWREALQALEVDGRAAVFKNRIEKYAQAARKLDVVACMAEPSGAKFRSRACGVEGWRADRDSGRGGVGLLGLTGDFAPGTMLA